MNNKEMENNLPGINGTTFKIILDRDWMVPGATSADKKLRITSKAKYSWWEKILKVITFNLYKPKKYFYEAEYTMGCDPYDEEKGSTSYGSVI